MSIKKPIVLILISLAALAVVILAVVFWTPMSRWAYETFNPEAIQGFLERTGPLAPGVFVAMVAAQVVLAPIPMQVLGVVGGYMFGVWWGTVYGLIGLTIGTAAAVWLARIFGRRLVERFVDGRTLDKFDHLSKQNGLLLFFLIFLIPGLPDDAICFIAGLTTLPISAVVLVSFLGRLPGLWYMNLIGVELRGDGDGTITIIITSVVVLLALLFIFRGKIEQFFVQHAPRRRSKSVEPGPGENQAIADRGDADE